MSLKTFHLFFITAALAMLAYTAYWSRANELFPMAAASAAAFLAGLPYSVWYLKRSRKFK